MSRQNTLCEVLDKLVNEKIINEDNRKRWLDRNYVKEFIDIVQTNYLVVPAYNNKRLEKQSGVLLLVSSFTVEINDTVEKGIITKSKANLRKEFEDDYFYIPGKEKGTILKELDLLGINEATLFPELEHQLNYIKFIHQDQTRTVSDFHRYEENYKKIISYENVNENILNEEFLREAEKILSNILALDDTENILKIIKDNLVVDWYKRENIRSKISRSINTYCLKNINSLDKNSIEHMVGKIMWTMNDLIKKHMFNG